VEVVEALGGPRLTLGRRLRAMRESAGLSGTDLAARLGWSQSRVSRLETGRQSAGEDDVRAVGAACGAAASVVEDLVAAAAALGREWTDHQAHLARGSQDRQAQIQELEARAGTVRTFQPALVPGLLQTPAYFRAVIDVERLVREDAEIASIVELRVERQRVLDDPGKSFLFLLTESALWNRFAPADVMRDQHRQLRVAADRPNVRLGIVPRSARLGAIPLTGFAVFDDTLVTIGTMTSEIVLHQAADIARYRHAFDQLSASAVVGARASAILDEISEALL
jgi:transcriptional regulator with XRE-family HTH domain